MKPCVFIQIQCSKHGDSRAAIDPNSPAVVICPLCRRGPANFEVLGTGWTTRELPWYEREQSRGIAKFNRQEFAGTPHTEEEFATH